MTDYHRPSLSSSSTATTSSSSSLPMISFGGGNSSSNKTPSLPRDVKDAVSQCRTAVQNALQKRLSRMDVEFPVGTKFGIETSKKNSKKSSSSSDGVTKDTLDTSDRELARLFVEMFQPVGGQNIAVVFTDDRLADLAKSRWKGEVNSDCVISSMNRRAKKKPKAKSRGFAAKLAAEMGDDPSSSSSSGPFSLPANCEVALFISPGPKELIAVERICRDVGMGTLVVLLNARLGAVEKFGSEEAKRLFCEEFEPVFHLGAAPQDVAPDCLLFRSFPEEWVMARKPKVGPPKTIGMSEKRMTREECLVAFESIEVGKGEEVVEGVLENVANWFT
eukprot:CAMPEP_0172496422 /NCGR_PEP_ID=MMETSP1066-20121228/87156_1 /TAXON_ID=671091 /ORGANISM="Coscinodiscus wailesii, Strain CCMP2513" /LENGTH=332 /DNA_ID=CAMNT_0013268719 /DNA_START=187 /DNA_END=1185 /DNA_ORIENTATION=-